jgi:hypothetical protein
LRTSTPSPALKSLNKPSGTPGAQMKLIDGAVILSFFTAILYCASTAFTHGYLGILHLDSDVLDRNLHGILYHGMILCLAPIIIGPLALFFLSICRSAVIVELSSNARKKFSSARKISKCLRFCWLRRKKKLTSLEKKHFELNLLLFKIAALSFAFLCLMVYLEKSGKKDANLLLASIKAETYTEIDSINSTIKPLAFLYCGSRNCAGLDPSSQEITYFPQEGHVIKKHIIKYSENIALLKSDLFLYKLIGGPIWNSFTTYTNTPMSQKHLPSLGSK